MLCWKQYLLEEKVDLCCVTETHFDEKREQLFKEVFGIEFHCLSKIRKNRKRQDYGSGGVAILVRKGRGRPKLARYKGSDEIVWAEIEGLGRTIHVIAV